MRDQLRRVRLEANASRITFYAVSGSRQSGFNVSSEIALPSAAPVETIDFFNREASLTALTEGTGGLRLPNAGALPTVVADLETSYSLGYSPDHFGDGEYHRLTVKVLRPGVSIRYREGYLDKTPEQEQADRTTAALLAGAGANPLGAQVTLGKADRQGRHKISLAVRVAIPAVNLVLLPNGESHEGKVSIALAVSNGAGRTTEAHRQSFPIRVPSTGFAPFLKHDTTFSFTLLIEPGDTTLAVTARDDFSGAESVLVSDLAGKRPN